MVFYILAGLLIILGTISNVSPIFSGYQNTPPGQVYLGTIHHPDDYFYYLSQFTQGADSWGLARDLYAHDFPTPTMVGWANVWMGKLGSVIGLESIKTYHLFVVIWTVVLLVSVGILFYQIVPERTSALPVMVLALFFFIFNNTFSYQVMEGGVSVWKQINFWFNFGIPGQRLGGVPHQLFMHVLLTWMFILIAGMFKDTGNRKKMIFLSVGLVIVSAMLAAIQPLHWLIGGTIAGIIGVQKIISHKIYKKAWHASMHRLFLQSFLITISGFIPAYNLYILFRIPPFSQMPAWEFANSIYVSPLTFLTGLGPVMIGSLVLLFSIGKKLKYSGVWMMVSYLLISVGLFFSPLPGILKLQNIRFVSALTIAASAFICAYAIVILTRRFGRRQYILQTLVAILFGIVVLPSYIVQWNTYSASGVGNAYIYVDRGVIDAMKEARRLSGKNDVFAVMWPFHKSFPAIAGRTIYYGHPLLTINSEMKGGENYHFFSNIKNPEQQDTFLRENGIDYVIAEPWAMGQLKVSSLELVFQNPSLWIAKVK